MTRTSSIVVAIIVLALAAGSFVATYAWTPRKPATPTCSLSGTSRPCEIANDSRCLAVWLQLSPEQTQQLASIVEPFAKRRPELEASLYAERQKLADLFESEEATDEQILAQVERVITANGALERCVAEYLVAIRPQLTDEQRARLYNRCAKGVREAGGCRWRYRDCGKSAASGESKTCPEQKDKNLNLTIPSGGCGMGATSRPACHKRCPTSSG